MNDETALLLVATAKLDAVRADSISVLARTGALDADQIEAALRFRSAFQVVADAAGESIGFREWRSPGGQPAVVVERRQIAKDELQQARALLGAYLYALVGRVAGEGYSVRDLFTTRRERDTHHDMLKISLHQLGGLWVRSRS